MLKTLAFPSIKAPSVLMGPHHPLSAPLYIGKTGTIWQFFRALLPSTWRTLSPDALFTRIWDTRKHPESATFSCFPC